MMRMALWPTERLWEAVADLIFPPNNDVQNSKLLVDVHKLSVVSLHFRCGDLNFKGGRGRTTEAIDTSCTAQREESGLVSWNGVNFGDATSPDSPLDMSSCALDIVDISSRQNLKNVLIYVASDNNGAVRQISDALNAINSNFSVIVPKSACHVDLDKSERCLISTFAYWFLIGLGDYVIMQSIDESETLYVQDKSKKGKK